MYSYQIEKAIQAAAVLHEGQNRKGVVPIPYVSHVFSVFLIASDYTDDEITLTAALLHDTIEDTTYTEEALIEDFGEEAHAVVMALSEDRTIEDWEARKENYIERVKSGGVAAMTVAAADKIHNMRSMIEQYANDIPGYLESFARYNTKGQIFLQNMSNMLNRELDSEIVNEFNHVFTEFKNFNEEVTNYTEENHG